MKRVIEKGNLAFNLQLIICEACKRCKGISNRHEDMFDCKYNKDRKGIYSGFVIDNMQDFKCKYFKRDQRFFTVRLSWKKYKSLSKGKTTLTKYKQGKFKIQIIKE